METIPLVDITHTTPVALLEDHAHRAQHLVASSKNSFGWISRLISHAALPIGDRMAKQWLKRTGNPYYAEIDEYHKRLGIAGIFALNLSYEWGCTSGVIAHHEGPILFRVLDWPFAGLGTHLIVAKQKRNAGGEFYNVTWPAVSGVFQASIRGKFSVALNQAPMRRYRSSVARDWIKNRKLMFAQNALPPGHLLRKVCEEAADYNEAHRMLSQTPVAIPVLYTLAGINAGEGAIIERIEQGARLREMEQKDRVTVANHFETALNGIGVGWAARAIDSFGRACLAQQITLTDAQDLTWFQPPIMNELSRLVMLAQPATGALTLRGLESNRFVTELFTL